MNHETDISTRPTETRAQTWFSGTDENEEWPSHTQITTGSRTSQTGRRLIDRSQSDTPIATARLKRGQRLLRGSEIILVMRQGQRFSVAQFTVHYYRTGATQARLGIAVGKRVSLRANRRNTVKRIIREGFRHSAAGLPAFDIVINAKPAAASTKRTDLASVITAVFKRLGRESNSSQPTTRAKDQA